MPARNYIGSTPLQLTPYLRLGLYPIHMAPEIHPLSSPYFRVVDGYECSTDNAQIWADLEW